MPEPRIAELEEALAACDGLRADNAALPAPVRALLARERCDWGGVLDDPDRAASLGRAGDELAACEAALAHLAEHQRRLSDARALVPEVEERIHALWSEITGSSAWAGAVEELVERLAGEGVAREDAARRVTELLGVERIAASLGEAVEAGYRHVQGLARAALRERHGAVLAKVLLLPRDAEGAPAGGPAQPSALARIMELRGALAVTMRDAQGAHSDEERETAEARLEKLSGEIQAAAEELRTVVPGTPRTPTPAGSRSDEAVRGLVGDGLETLRAELASGTEAASSTATRLAERFAERIEELLFGAAPLGDAVAHLLRADALARCVRWDLGWAPAFEAPGVWRREAAARAGGDGGWIDWALGAVADVAAPADRAPSGPRWEPIAEASLRQRTWWHEEAHA